MDQIRILVGRNVGRTTFDLLDAHRGQDPFGYESHARARTKMQDHVVAEMEHVESVAKRVPTGQVLYRIDSKLRTLQAKRAQRNGGT